MGWDDFGLFEFSDCDYSVVGTWRRWWRAQIAVSNLVCDGRLLFPGGMGFPVSGVFGDFCLYPSLQRGFCDDAAENYPRSE